MSGSDIAITLFFCFPLIGAGWEIYHSEPNPEEFYKDCTDYKPGESSRERVKNKVNGAIMMIVGSVLFLYLLIT